MLVIVKPLKVQYLITVGWKRYAQTKVLNIHTTYRTSFHIIIQRVLQQ